MPLLPAVGSAERRRAAVWFSIAFLAGVFVLRLVLENPNDAVMYLFVIPVALMGHEYGVKGGLLTAAAAFTLFVAWVVIDDVLVDPIGYLARAGAFFPVGAMVGATSTEARMARRAEREAAAAAERSKDEFFALISHELRTPLTSIIGYTELLAEMEAESLSGQSQHFIDVIERNARREMRLVDDLLTLVRINAGSFVVDREPLEISQVVEEAVDAARPRAEAAGVLLRLEGAARCSVLGDPHRLGQVADNLLSNAIKFTPEGGEVTVRVRRGQAVALIEVQDSGVGIPQDELNRLFERLFRASTAVSREIPGLGLGLAITRAIVEAHGGEIGVESEEGIGTAFTVRLPEMSDEAASLAPEQAPAQAVL